MSDVLFISHWRWRTVKWNCRGLGIVFGKHTIDHVTACQARGPNLALEMEVGYLICKLEILTVSVLGRKWGGPQVGGKEDLIVFQGPAVHGEGPGQRSLPSVEVSWPSNMELVLKWEARDGQGWPQGRAQLMDPRNMYIWCPVLIFPS